MGYTKLKELPASKIQQLMTMGPDELVRVYTRQDPEGWRAAMERGYLTGAHGATDTDNEDFAYTYEWMRQQMAERLPEFSGDLPVWAWVKRQNERKWVTSWQTDLRAQFPIYPRIIALVPRKRILLSCYELWHCHLNNWNIPLSEEEYEAYEAKWPTYKPPGSDPEYQRETETNWSMVFDIHLPRPPYVQENYGRVGVIQACVDRIYMDEVQSVRWMT